MNHLKIALITSLDPANRRAWSGIVHSIYTIIGTTWGQAQWLGPVPRYRGLWGKVCNRLSEAALRKAYDYQHSIAHSLRFGCFFNRKLKQRPYDIIVAPAASTEIACLKTTIPIVYVVDATFALVVDYYSVYSNLSTVSIREGNWIERKALTKASIILCASNWARQSVVETYRIDESKVRVVPFGANIDEALAVGVALKRASDARCNVLFLGVDWERKGGSIAFDAMVYLTRMGMDVRLFVCGCTPPASLSHERMEVVPFIDKTEPGGRAKFHDLLAKMHFLLLPTRAEGFGIVFCEASAFGIPAIATDTGGVSSAITNGENGYLLPLQATGEDYALLMHAIFSDKPRYSKLVESSRRAYEQRLNWNCWADIAREIIKERLKM